MQPATRRVLLSILVGSVLASLVGNAYFVWERSARRRAEQTIEPLLPGTPVPSIAAEDAAGERTVVSFSGHTRPTVLYVLSPNCLWCERNGPSLRELVEKTEGRFRFIGLSVRRDGLSEHLSRNAVPFPVYVASDESIFRTLRVRAVPTTIVVSAEGRAIASIVGAWAKENKGKIESVTHTQLSAAVDEEPKQ